MAKSVTETKHHNYPKQVVYQASILAAKSLGWQITDERANLIIAQVSLQWNSVGNTITISFLNETTFSVTSNSLPTQLIAGSRTGIIWNTFLNLSINILKSLFPIIINPKKRKPVCHYRTIQLYALNVERSTQMDLNIVQRMARLYSSSVQAVGSNFNQILDSVLNVEPG